MQHTHKYLHTFEVKRFIPSGVQGPSFDFRLQPVFFVREKSNTDVGVWRAAHILGRQFLRLKQDIHGFQHILHETKYSLSGTYGVGPTLTQHPFWHMVGLDVKYMYLTYTYV